MTCTGRRLRRIAVIPVVALGAILGPAQIAGATTGGPDLTPIEADPGEFGGKEGCIYKNDKYSHGAVIYFQNDREYVCDDGTWRLYV